jgi:hypothetical protein
MFRRVQTTPLPPELSPATEAVKTMQPCAFFSSGSAAFAP